MNVGEAITRLTTAIWAFFQIEGEPTETFTLNIEHAYEKGSLATLKYRVVLRGFKTKVNQELFEPVNVSGLHVDLETALEFAFSQVGAIITKFMELRMVEIKKAEAELDESKNVYMKLERNRREMGMYNPLQEPLPFPEPVVISVAS